MRKINLRVGIGDLPAQATFYIVHKVTVNIPLENSGIEKNIPGILPKPKHCYHVGMSWFLYLPPEQRRHM